MKINPASQSLAGALDTLENVIKPELKSDEAKVYLKTIQTILKDLVNRHGLQADFLRKILVQGAALHCDITRVLEPPSFALPKHTVPGESVGYEELAARHEELTVEIFHYCERLLKEKKDHPETAALLRRGAEWELAYYESIKKVPAHALPIEDPQQAPSLTENFMAKFLVGKRGIVEIHSFSRMSGGNGKQTFTCFTKNADGSTEQIVIRKEDSVPLLQLGAASTRQEFALLRSLMKTDFPCPQVYEHCPAVAGPDGVDAGFFTMSLLPGKCKSSFLSASDAVLPEKLLLDIAEHQAKLHAYPLETFSDYINDNEDVQLLQGQTVTERYRVIVKKWWEYYVSNEHSPSPYIIWLLQWMANHLPKDDRRPVLTHGDFNIHNVLTVDDKVSSVLDWETADFAAPEQDLAYVQQIVSKHVSWDKFLERYLAAGGRRIDPAHFAFCQAYSALRTTLTFNKATRNLQTGLSSDIRFNLLELGYQSIFMSMGLKYTAELDASTTTGNGTYCQQNNETVGGSRVVLVE